MSTTDNRSTKKQRELLDYIEQFIKQHGYGPSYREIMHGLGYKSVSTVAIHVDGLIARGYLHKKNRSARSLELAGRETFSSTPATNHAAWLRQQVQQLIEKGIEPSDQAALVRATELILQKPLS